MADRAPARPPTGDEPAASAVLPDGSAPLLLDVAAEVGLASAHENGARGARNMPESVIGGAGWIDYDGDGRFDVYLVTGNEHSARGGRGGTGNKLYANRGGARFEDVTAAAGVGDDGYGCGLAVGDVDNDGLSDLYVTNYGPNVLYRNTGGGRFADVSAAAGVAGDGWNASAAFLDLQNDGFLDLYVCRYVDFDPAHQCQSGGKPIYCGPREFPGIPDRLYVNRGDGTFEDVSRAAGVDVAGPNDGKSLGVVATDYDDDGDVDVYVACDQVRNLLFRNDGGGKLTEVGLLANAAYSAEGAAQAGMGVDAGDANLDGRFDLVVTNFAEERYAYYRNDGGGFFEDASGAVGIGRATFEPVGFGVLLFDVDLDSDLDLYFANGHVMDNIAEIRPGQTYAQRDTLLLNEAGKRFADVSARSGDWFARALVTRAAATADFDEDGDEDVLVVVNGGPPALLANRTSGGHWIAFRLRGTQSNRDGYGAKVTVRARGPRGPFERVFECRSARSYLAACDPRVRCGLGAGEVTVLEVEVRWPSGRVQRVSGPAIDRVHELVEPSE